MTETSLAVAATSEIESLVAQAKQLQASISKNQDFVKKEADNLICPVCQSGHLRSEKRGKAFKVFADVWLVCDLCRAEFDKKLGKATLMKVAEDPYSVGAKYLNKTLDLKEWSRIVVGRIQGETNRHVGQLDTIKDKVAAYITDQFVRGELPLTAADLRGFILKKGEKPLFSTKAEVIEERKRKVTQRTTTGGGRRNYSGFSFRIARGIYYHTGSSSAASPRQTTVQSTEYTELVTADYGDFVITNKRIMFKGNRSRGLAIPINKLAALDVDPDEGALLIIQENKKPAMLKIETSLKMKIGNLEIPLSVDLDDLSTVVSQAAAV